MSNSSWKNSLHLLLQQREQSKTEPVRVAIVGIGNEYRNDDAAGVMVARLLLRYENPGHALILRAGHAPENFTGGLRKYAPDLIMLVDAADMGFVPGTVALIPFDQIDGMTASTHSLPLSMLARYLTLELACTVVVLGIQPRSNDVGERVSAEVLEAVAEVAESISALCLTRLPG